MNIDAFAQNNTRYLVLPGMFNFLNVRNDLQSAIDLSDLLFFKTEGCNKKLKFSCECFKRAATYVYLPNPIIAVEIKAIPMFDLLQTRIAGQYNISVLRNTILGFEVSYDSAYSESHHGNGKSLLTDIARLLVIL